MLTDAAVDELAESIVSGAEEHYVSEVNDQLLSAFKSGVVNGKVMQSLETLARTNSSAVDAITAKYRDRISDETMASVMKVLGTSTGEDMETLNSIYGPTEFAKGMSTHFQAVSAETAQGVAEIIARDNLAMTDEVKRKWYEVSGKAISAIDHGLVTEDKAISDAVDALTGASIKTIDYKSGVSSQLDVAVRRHVVTQVSQAGGRMTMEAMVKYGHTIVSVSAHYGARPSHALWQGQAYSLREGGETVDGHLYPDFYSGTGYEGLRGPYTKLGDQLKGVNCRHSFGPFYPGISTLPDTDFSAEREKFGMSSDEFYEATQRQHVLESRIRKTKREIYGLEKQGLGLKSPAYVQKRLVLGRQQKELAKWCEDNKLERVEKNEKAYGIGEQPRALKVLKNNAIKKDKWNTKPKKEYGPRSANRMIRGQIEMLQSASDKAVSDMDEAEIEAISEYTQGLYNNVNGLLYKTRKLTRKKRDEAELCMKNLDRAMDKFELTDKVVVFSGTNAAHYAEWKPGEKHVIEGYLSTSVFQGEADRFMFIEETNGSVPLLLEIRVPIGARCLYIGDNTFFHYNQGELLLERGSEFKVISRDSQKMVLEVVV